VFVKNTGGVNIKLSSNISQAEAQMGPNTSVGNLLPAADGKAGLELSIVHQNDPAKGATIDCGFHDSPNVVHCSAVRFG
jgi:hypothetical protein